MIFGCIHVLGKTHACIPMSWIRHDMVSKVVAYHNDLLTEWRYILVSLVCKFQRQYLFDANYFELHLTQQKIGLIFVNIVLQKLRFSKHVNNKKCAPKLIFFNEKKKIRKIWMIFDIGYWLWKSEFCKLLRTRSSSYQKYICLEFTHLYTYCISIMLEIIVIRHNLGHSCLGYFSYGS